MLRDPCRSFRAPKGGMCNAHQSHDTMFPQDHSHIWTCADAALLPPGTFAFEPAADIQMDWPRLAVQSPLPVCSRPPPLRNSGTKLPRRKSKEEGSTLFRTLLACTGSFKLVKEHYVSKNSKPPTTYKLTRFLPRAYAQCIKMGYSSAMVRTQVLALARWDKYWADTDCFMLEAQVSAWLSDTSSSAGDAWELVLPSTPKHTRAMPMDGNTPPSDIESDEELGDTPLRSSAELQLSDDGAQTADVANLTTLQLLIHKCRHIVGNSGLVRRALGLLDTESNTDQLDRDGNERRKRSWIDADDDIRFQHTLISGNKRQKTN